MAMFIFTYRVPNQPLAELDEAGRAAGIAAWNSWFEQLGEHVVDRGSRVLDARPVGNCDASLRLGGYTLIRADDLDAAAALAAGCPGIAWGGGVEVGVLDDTADTGRPAAGERTVA